MGSKQSVLPPDSSLRIVKIKDDPVLFSSLFSKSGGPALDFQEMKPTFFSNSTVLEEKLLALKEMDYYEKGVASKCTRGHSDIKLCPKCKSSVVRKDQSNLCVRCLVCTARNGQIYEFCWQCLRKWKGPTPRSDRCETNGCTNDPLKTLKAHPGNSPLIKNNLSYDESQERELKMGLQKKANELCTGQSQAVTVCGPTGETKRIPLSSNMTVQQLKEQIVNSLLWMPGLSMGDVPLVLKGKTLENSTRLSECQLLPSSAIQLVLRVQEGECDGGLKSFRIILLGKSGAGKSSLANTIFGENVFKINHSATCGTSERQAESKSVHGRRLTVIDPPDFFDADRPEEEVEQEIERCFTECAPGPHVFLIVLKVEKFTVQEQEKITEMCQYFSEEVFKFAVLVFTHGDQLPGGMTIEEFVEQNKCLSDLVKWCRGRCHVVDNKYWKNNKQSDYRCNQFQVTEILRSIEQAVMENKEGYYMLRPAGKMTETTSKTVQKTKREAAIQTVEEETVRDKKRRLNKQATKKRKAAQSSRPENLLLNILGHILVTLSAGAAFSGGALAARAGGALASGGASAGGTSAAGAGGASAGGTSAAGAGGASAGGTSAAGAGGDSAAKLVAAVTASLALGGGLGWVVDKIRGLIDTIRGFYDVIQQNKGTILLVIVFYSLMLVSFFFHVPVAGSLLVMFQILLLLLLSVVLLVLL